jgi:hypothetical protein
MWTTVRARDYNKRGLEDLVLLFSTITPTGISKPILKNHNK